MLAQFWGILLLLPGDTFAGIEHYRLIGQFLPDQIWGIVFFTLGFATLFPFPTNLLKHLHWLLCTLWLGISVLALLSSFTIPALLIGALAFFVAMVHAGKFWRLSRPPLVRL